MGFTIKPGDVIGYLEMCQAEGVNLQRGMNFRLRGNISVVLMSRRVGAPYDDKVENNGKVLIYEGHDTAKTADVDDPKSVDQPMYTSGGSLTQNGLFYNAAKSYEKGKEEKEKVRVYEKLYPGVWVYNGTFGLIGAWKEINAGRQVFKFRLELIANAQTYSNSERQEIENTRVIPSSVKQEVWKRDKGQCVKCGSKENLHFDHIIPYSKGGSSLVAENVQLLCAKHNLAKRDKIE